MTGLTIAFLGREGAFSEEAARAYAARVGGTARLLGAPHPAEVLALVARGACARAVLPIANTAGGLVLASLAALAHSGFTVVDEVVVPVRFSLLVARADLAPDAIRRVASHPMALRQCARTLGRLLPGYTTLATSDTASAAHDLAEGRLGLDTAVLASARAGERYGLACLVRDVHDESDSRTFFVVLERGAGPSSCSGPGGD